MKERVELVKEKASARADADARARSRQRGAVPAAAGYMNSSPPPPGQ
jgi:hypothetical protein